MPPRKDYLLTDKLLCGISIKNPAKEVFIHFMTKDKFKSAFSVESQAHMKYLIFADNEGRIQEYRKAIQGYCLCRAGSCNKSLECLKWKQSHN